MQALVIFLTKLRTGSSNSLIAVMFKLKNDSLVSDIIESVINAFESDILSSEFGFKACNRNDLISNHTTEIVKKLFDVTDELVIIVDGTYVEHEKSRNNEYQRRSYNMHKHYNLVKPFTICTSNGYVLDVPCYSGSTNDAEIFRNILDNSEGLSSLLRTGDLIVMDRGFRDVIEDVREKGYKAVMPALKGNRRYLPTDEANLSRFVTKIRWVVEAVHGIIGQKFKLLHNQFKNKSLEKLEAYVRIANYLHNEFSKRFSSDDKMVDEIVKRMKSRLDTENTLAKEVEAGKYNRKTKIFTKLKSSSVQDFPELSIDQLKLFFCGSYQLSQAICYLGELLDEEDDQFDIEYCKERENLLRFHVQSRHVKKNIYICYIEYHPNQDNIDGIHRYCCNCANGYRTVGSCCHVAAIIYYLAYARYQEEIIRPAKFLSELFEAEELIPIINEDSDEEE